ncbi:MAG: preprotein translocase subunit SecE [Pseudonocardiales bacterium]
MTQTSGGATQTPRKPPADLASDADRPNPFRRLARFYREVVAELRKVIWPTRRELVTYTTVVVVFVSIIVAIVAGLDLGFAKLVLIVFG